MRAAHGGAAHSSTPMCGIWEAPWEARPRAGQQRTAHCALCWPHPVAAVSLQFRSFPTAAGCDNIADGPREGRPWAVRGPILHHREPACRRVRTIEWIRGARWSLVCQEAIFELLSSPPAFLARNTPSAAIVHRERVQRTMARHSRGSKDEKKFNVRVYPPTRHRKILRKF